MYIVWLNVLKKIRLEYDSAKSKYNTKFIFEHDMGLVYFTGFNIHMSDACFVFCQFNYPTETEETKEGVISKVVPSLTWQRVD